MPVWLGNILAGILTRIGPTGLEFGRYSLDYHTIRNYLYVKRHWPGSRAEQHLPAYAKQIVAEYDQGGQVSDRQVCKDALHSSRYHFASTAIISKSAPIHVLALRGVAPIMVCSASACFVL